MRAGNPGLGEDLAGGQDFGEREAFVEGGKRGVAGGVRPQFGRGKAGSFQEQEIALGEILRSEKGAPRCRVATPDKRLGNFQEALGRIVEDAVGKKDIAGAHILSETRHLLGHLFRLTIPDLRSFKRWVGTIAAAVRTAAFCLDIEHAAMGQIIVGNILLKDRGGIRVIHQWLREDPFCGRGARGNLPGQPGQDFLPFAKQSSIPGDPSESEEI